MVPSTIIIGWDENGNEKAIPTDTEANETIDHIAKKAGLHVWLPLPAEDAVEFAEGILRSARGERQ